MILTSCTLGRRKIATRQQRLLALVLGDTSRAFLLRIGETEVARAENSGRLARFRLWLDRSDRVRIHEKVLDYEFDGVATKPVPTCEIRMEKERGVAHVADARYLSRNPINSL